MRQERYGGSSAKMQAYKQPANRVHYSQHVWYQYRKFNHRSHSLWGLQTKDQKKKGSMWDGQQRKAKQRVRKNGRCEEPLRSTWFKLGWNTLSKFGWCTFHTKKDRI